MIVGETSERRREAHNYGLFRAHRYHLKLNCSIVNVAGPLKNDGEMNYQSFIIFRKSFFFVLFRTSLAGNSGGLTWERHVQHPQEQRYPFLSVCAVFSCVETMVWMPVFGICIVIADADACDCTRGAVRTQ